MTNRTVREIRVLLAPLDPAPLPPSVPLPRQASSAPAGTASRRRTRPARRLLLVTAVAAALLVGGVVTPIDVPGVSLRSAVAYQATPAPLVLGAPRPEGAARRLAAIASRAERTPLPGSGPYDHLAYEGWYLGTRVDGHVVSSAVLPQVFEVWIGRDGSGRRISAYGAPTFPTPEHERAWRRNGSPGGDGNRHDEPLTPDQPLGWWQGTTLSTDPVLLARQLQHAHPVENGPAEVLVAISDLHRERVLDGPLRAAVLRVLATVPGMEYHGGVTDRRGRVGAAFSLEHDLGGLPTRTTFVVDEATGQLLATEDVLTTTAGMLQVPIPSVTSYETFLVAESAEGTGR